MCYCGAAPSTEKQREGEINVPPNKYPWKMHRKLRRMAAFRKGTGRLVSGVVAEKGDSFHIEIKKERVIFISF